LKNHRISTTISQKHWALLNKYMEKYHTQQNVMEHALESLEKNSEPRASRTKEEELWFRIGMEIRGTLVIFQKDSTKILLDTADIERLREYAIKEKPIEFAIEYYYQKHLKECSLQELIDGIIINIKMQNSSAAIDYKDNGDSYTINVSHSLGINMSKLLVIMHESLFKSYGVRYECKFSERSIFFKIYKN
jgi:hypothetical protein